MPAPTRYVALFGPRACGKTVYLGALYGTSTNGGLPGAEYHVASDDDREDPTHVYLARAYRDLVAGSWPPGTAFDELKRMSLGFTTNGAAYRVVLPDVGGELTKRVKDVGEYDLATRELKEKILREYQDYHGFLVFAPVGRQAGLDGVEYKWEVDALIQALKERTQDGGLISRPVAVVLSKWDLRGPIPAEEAEAAAAAYFAEAYPELAAGLTATCKNLRVFPVSSTGQLRGGKPPAPLAPFNLGAPLTWLLKTSDEVLLDLLEARLRSWSEVLFRRDHSRSGRPTHFALAMEGIDAFLSEVPRGPLAERAEQHRRSLLTLRRIRRTKIFGVLTTAVAVALCLFGAARDRGTYQDMQRLMQAASSTADQDEVLIKVNAALSDRWHFVGRSLGWWQDLAEQRDNFHSKYEETRYEEIEKASTQSSTDAKRLLELTDRFRATFPGSKRIPDVGVIRDTAQNTVDAAEEQQAYSAVKELYDKFKGDQKNTELAKSLLELSTTFLESHKIGLHSDEVQKIKTEVDVARIAQQRDFDFAQLKAELGKSAENALKCYQLCTTFLATSPDHPEADSLRSWQDDYLRKADDQAWDAVIAYAANYPNKHADQITMCERYTENTLFNAHREEAKTLRGAALRGLDRTAYEAIWQMAKDGSEPDVLDTLQRLCRAYLANPAISNKVMEDEVEAWLKWFDSWVGGRDFYVKVESVRVNSGSQWHYSIYWPTVWAEVRVKGTNHRTGSKRIDLDQDERGLPNSHLGPFHWKWNDPVVKVVLGWDGANPPEFSTTYPDDAFSVCHLNGPIEFDGGKISLLLNCPDVIPPPLLPYKE